MNWLMFRKVLNHKGGRSRGGGRRFASLSVLLSVLLPILLATSCGIETIPYLYPVDGNPPTGYDEQSKKLVFYHQDDNEDPLTADLFGGYNIYYKLYLNNSKGRQLFDEDVNTINSTPRIPGSSRLESRNYMKMVTEEDSEPQIEFDVDVGPIGISFDMEPPPVDETKELIATWTLDNGVTYQSKIFRRRSLSLGSTFDDYEELWSDSRFNSSDFDIANMIPSSEEVPITDEILDTTGLFISVFVITYGFDIIVTAQRIYSEPTLISVDGVNL